MIGCEDVPFLRIVLIGCERSGSVATQSVLIGCKNDDNVLIFRSYRLTVPTVPAVSWRKL